MSMTTSFLALQLLHHISCHFIPRVFLTTDSDSDPNDEIAKLTMVQQLLETCKRGQINFGAYFRKNNYLFSLRERTQKLSQQMNRSPQIGEVVLIKDDLPHSRWKVGKIVELFMGRDQKIRSAKVLVSPRSYLH